MAAKDFELYAVRSKTVAVNTVQNRTGFYVNLIVDGVPRETFGPMPQAMTLCEALVYVATVTRISGDYF